MARIKWLVSAARYGAQSASFGKEKTNNVIANMSHQT